VPQNLFIRFTFTVPPGETDNGEHGRSHDGGDSNKTQTNGEESDYCDPEVNTYLT
jgi:hypothetical protein